jgi:hypothetical protein
LQHWQCCSKKCGGDALALVVWMGGNRVDRSAVTVHLDVEDPEDGAVERGNELYRRVGKRCSMWLA